MGTDIHRVAEWRGPDGWECVPLDFYCGGERNYALFAILAGVRRMTNGGCEPIVPLAVYLQTSRHRSVAKVIPRPGVTTITTPG